MCGGGIRFAARGRLAATGDLDAVALVSGNAIYAASQLALVIVIAKLGSVVQVGHFAYAGDDDSSFYLLPTTVARPAGD